MRRTTRAFALFLVISCVQATAGDASEDAFFAAADVAYHQGLARLSARGRLDDDVGFGERVRTTSSRLIAAAPQVRPASDHWAWEVHTTSDPSIAAFCLAGGKLLVGRRFVEHLELNDDELAMLMAHEMAHALAGHRRERAPAGGLETDLAWDNRQAEIAMAQELEADRLGLELAHRAGWSLVALLPFFDKLAQDEPPGTFSASHPQAAQRAVDAREWAAAMSRSASPAAK